MTELQDFMEFKRSFLLIKLIDWHFKIVCDAPNWLTVTAAVGSVYNTIYVMLLSIHS